MPEVIIKYKNPGTLKILKSLAKYLDFKVSKEKSNEYSVNGVTIVKRDLNAITLKRKKALEEITVPANKEADLSQLFEVFTGKNLDAKKLREEMWRTKK